MKITLKIYSGLKRYVKDYNSKNGLILEIDKGKNLKKLIIDTINHQKAIEDISMITLIDKIIAYQNYNQKLKDGDLIKVFPPISGG